LGQIRFREGERQEGLLRGRLVIEPRREGERRGHCNKKESELLGSQKGNGSKTRAFTLYLQTLAFCDFFQFHTL